MCDDKFKDSVDVFYCYLYIITYNELYCTANIYFLTHLGIKTVF